MNTIIAMLLAFGAMTEPVDPLSAAEFRKLHAALVPARTQLWQTIPWQTGLLDARRQSLATGKPLFIWSMNGHPLGCT